MFLIETQAKENHEIIVSMHPLEPFIVAQQGRIESGFIVDIYKELVSGVKLPISLEVTSFNRALKLLQTKPITQIDSVGVKTKIHRAHLIVVRTKAREKLFKWVGPLLYDGSVIYKKSSDIRRFQRLEDLKESKAICTVQKSVSDTELFSEMGIDYYEFDSQEDSIISMVKGDRFDCTPIAIMNSDTILRTIGVSKAKLKPIEFQLPAQAIYMAFSLETPDEIIDQWQKSLEMLNKNDQRISIIRKYVPMYSKSLEDKLKESQKSSMH